MHRDNVREPILDLHPSSFRRISWSAVFAGVVVALVAEVSLALLGIGIGAASFAPLQEAEPGRGLGTGSAIWFALTTVVALFIGGWVASRLSGVPHRTEGLLHGVVTWGVTTLAMLWMLGSTVGALIGGAAGMVGHGVQAAGQVARTAVEHADQGQRAEAIETIRQRAGEALRQTGHPEARPDSLHSRARDAVQAARQNVQAARDPRYSDEALEQVLDRIDRSGTEGSHPSDRQDLIQILTARTGMSGQEAEARVADWERDNLAVMRDYEQAQARAEQGLREAGSKAATAVSAVAIASFVILLLGLAAAALGGATGTPYAVRA